MTSTKTTATTTVIASHHFAWKTFEIVALALTTGVGILGTIAAKPILLGLCITAVGVGYTLIAARRKKRSLIEISDDNGRWTLVRNHVPQSGRGTTVRFADVTRIDFSMTTGGGSNVILSTEESADHSSDLLIIPERLARQDAIYGKLMYAAGQTDVTATRSARTFLGITDSYDEITR
jgi:hypothetical protein